MATYYDETGPELIEKVITVNRNSKVVKGGRRYSFSALVVVGDGNGAVGLGFGKANEVTDAISKALTDGRRSMISVSRYNTTIPFQITGKYKAGKVFLKPATTGTGIIAGGAVRAIIEAAGLHDILSKNMGSNNSINIAKATLEALKSLNSKKNVFARRGISMPEPAEQQASAAPETNEQAVPEPEEPASQAEPVQEQRPDAPVGEQDSADSAAAAPVAENEAGVPAETVEQEPGSEHSAELSDAEEEETKTE